jgi:ElaB/YqjD/DUF883 family membrane-anchored ribosome-binding protein
MRTKTGNGQNVNLDQFLEDIKVVVRDGEALLKAGASEFRQKALVGAQTTERLVHERPYQAIGIAFGLGVIVGFLAAGAGMRETHADED